MLNTLLMRKHIELLNTLHPTQIDKVFNYIDNQVNKIIFQKKKTQKKKLDKLIKQQSKPIEQFIIDHQFYPRVKNLTDIVFTDNEMNILNKGLKHNILGRICNKNLISEILNAEIAINSIPDVNSRNYVRHVIDKKIKTALDSKKHKSSSFKNEFVHVKTIKDKLLTHDCIVTRADKGQSVVIMKINEYNEKVFDFLNNNNVKEIENDPTNKFQNTLKNVLNNSQYILDGRKCNHLKMINPRAPVLRGLPKVHKEQMPIRPLVNFTSAPSYKVAKALDKILRNNIKLNNNHSLKNSLELIDFTKNIKLENRHTMASLDIVNLYTNIPVLRTLEITKDNLLAHSELSANAINELIHLLRITLAQNYFTFNGKFYLQEEGLAMGSPLSSILSEIYLNDFENTNIFSESNKFASKIIFYKRYVDDTIVFFNGNIRQLNSFTNYLNSTSPHLKFTLETELNESINFLDLTLIKTNNGMSYKIYRKPTATDHTIHASSNHPQSHKMAAYNCFVNRLIKIPMTQDDYNQEYTILKYIAVSNGYQSNIIDKIISKQKNKNRPDLPNAKFISVEFGNSLYHTLKNELKKQNIILACKTSNKLERQLNKPHSIDTNTRLNDTGVYKLSCSDCPKVYVGQSGRSFQKRFKEHLPKPKLQTQRSKFAEHLVNENHNVISYNDNLSILHKCNKGHVMNVLENFEIYKAFKNSPKDVLNEKLNFGSNILFDRMEALLNKTIDQLMLPGQGQRRHQVGIG